MGKGTKNKDRLLKAYGILIIFMATTYALQAVLAFATNNYYHMVISIVTSIIWMMFYPIFRNYIKSLKKLDENMDTIQEQVQAYKDADKTALTELIKMTAGCPICYKKAMDLFEIRHGKE